MVSMKKLKKTLKSMKKFITTLTRGKRRRPSKQELKEAKRRKLEERNNLISREQSRNEINVSGDHPTALKKDQASSSKPGPSGVQRLNSDEFFAQILNKVGSGPGDQVADLPAVSFGFGPDVAEKWTAFGSSVDSEEMFPTISELFEKDQSLEDVVVLTTDDIQDLSSYENEAGPSGVSVEEDEADLEVDILSCLEELGVDEETEIERVFYSDSNDSLVGMIPRYDGILFLPDGDISGDIMKLSQSSQEVAETEKQQLVLPTIVLTPPEESDDSPQVLFQGTTPVTVTSDQQVLVLGSGYNPLLELSDKAFAELLYSQKVLLEYCAFLDSSPSLLANIRVENLAYEKYVFARVTSNGWTTFSDIKAEHVSSSDGLTSDKFSFELPAGRPVEFAICYMVNGQTYWDNNNGGNYSVQ